MAPVKKRLRKLSDEIPDDATVRNVLQMLGSEHNSYADHAIAMIGASIVDKALEVAILTYFRSSLSDDERNGMFRFDQNGPLADFSSRIKIADALGILGPKSKEDVGYIREIRNTFAHAPKLISFSHQTVAEACSKLQVAEWSQEAPTVQGSGPRALYIETTLALASHLKREITSSPTDVYLSPPTFKTSVRLP